MAVDPSQNLGDQLKTRRDWHQHVWSLSWPVILANVTVPLVGLVDVVVLGRSPDPIYIAAVAMGAAMFNAVYWLFGFLRMGTTGLSAQAYGRRDMDEVAAIFVRAISVAIGLGLLIVALQSPLVTLLLSLFQPSAELGALSTQYYDIRVWGAPAMLIHFVELGILFGLQRMTYTLYLSVGLNLTNLILDVVFVIGLDMGVPGVAMGTVISEWGAAGFGLFLVLRALSQINANVARDALSDAQALLAFFSIGGNLIIRTFFVQLPFFAGTVLATRLDETTLALHGVLMQLFFVMTYTLDAFAHSAETLTGYFYGAKDAIKLRLAAIYSTVWGGGLAVIQGLVYLVFGTVFVSLMTESIGIQNSSQVYMGWVALAPILCVGAFLLDGIFIGTTHIKEMRNAMIASTVIWAAVLALTFSSYQYHAVWFCMNLFMLTRTILLGWQYPKIERAAGVSSG